VDAKERDWNENYAEGQRPWDSGRPSKELDRLLGEHEIEPCRVLEVGCGTGTNAVHLAQKGFTVTAFDISPIAIDEAKAKAKGAGVSVDFSVGDALAPPKFNAPFSLVFDRGVYHVVRQVNLEAFMHTLSDATEAGSLYLVLAGNANEEDQEEGPPRVHASEMCRELEPFFELVELREFRFDAAEIDGKPFEPLAWSAVWRRKELDRFA